MVCKALKFCHSDLFIYVLSYFLNHDPCPYAEVMMKMKNMDRLS